MLLDLSIVVAVYNEDPRNLEKLRTRLLQVLSERNLSYEIVFVNDGSNPITARALRELAERHDYIKLIEFARNFGQQAAITAGLDHSDGLAIVNLDSDLQDPPELIPEMFDRWKQGYDVVYAQRSTRRDKVGKRLSAYLFYRLLGSMSSVQIPWDTGDFRLMDRKVVDALRALPEKTRFLRGLIPWLGFRQIGIPIDRGAREMGESAYTLRKLIALALDGLLSLSVMPLYAVSIVGFVVIALSIVAFLAAILLNQHYGQLTWLIVLAGVGVFTGVQILCTGVMAIYLSKVLDEVRARPTYVVAERIGARFEQASAAGASRRPRSQQIGIAAPP